MDNPEKALKQILYAEDDPDIRTIVQLTMQAMTEVELIICEGGIEAVEKSKQIVPDLVLLDIMMPDMDGLAVFDYLRQQENYRGVPVVFMTAKVQSHEVRQYRKLGAVDVITKPFDPVELPKILNAIWNDVQQKRFE
ncbi:response regulator [Endozoicomonas sp.]|uniref:response regulator n=1 Tax=Endozoicomonas sp. TaxID=1892382 RepID=UPI0028865DE3|nr:response regulator [Endozoicomonas sp.]